MELGSLILLLLVVIGWSSVHVFRSTF